MDGEGFLNILTIRREVIGVITIIVSCAHLLLFLLLLLLQIFFPPQLQCEFLTSLSIPTDSLSIRMLFGEEASVGQFIKKIVQFFLNFQTHSILVNKLLIFCKLTKLRLPYLKKLKVDFFEASPCLLLIFFHFLAIFDIDSFLRVIIFLHMILILNEDYFLQIMNSVRIIGVLYLHNSISYCRICSLLQLGRLIQKHVA